MTEGRPRLRSDRDERSSAALYTLTVPDRWVLDMTRDAIEDIKRDLIRRIVDETLERIRPEVAAMLTPETIGKAVNEGLVQAVANFFTQRQK